MSPEILNTASPQKNASAPVNILTFGGLRIRVGDTVLEESEWRGQCTKLLLKAVIVHGGTKVPVEFLTDTLWPDVGLGRAVGNLKVTLLRLRKIVTGLGISNQWIEMKNKLVSLSNSVCSVDSLEFMHSLSMALDDADQIVPLIKALDLYSEDFLINDIHVEWITNHRRRLQDAYIKGVLVLFDRLATAGKADRPIPLLLRAADMDPLNEELYVRLMQAYIDQGYPSKAMLIFNQAQDILKKTLSTGPGENLLSVVRGIRSITAPD